MSVAVLQRLAAQSAGVVEQILRFVPAKEALVLLPVFGSAVRKTHCQSLVVSELSLEHSFAIECTLEATESIKLAYAENILTLLVGPDATSGDFAIVSRYVCSVASLLVSGIKFECKPLVAFLESLPFHKLTLWWCSDPDLYTMNVSPWDVNLQMQEAKEVSLGSNIRELIINCWDAKLEDFSLKPQTCLTSLSLVHVSADLTQIEQFKHVKALTLIENGIDQFPNMSEFRNLERLFWNNEVTSVPLLPCTLKHLSLSSVSTTEELDFSNLKLLEAFELSEACAPTLNLTNLHRLGDLKMHCCEDLQIVGLQTLSGLSSFATDIAFDYDIELPGNLVSFSCFSELKAINQALPKLTSLTVSQELSESDYNFEHFPALKTAEVRISKSQKCLSSQTVTSLCVSGDGSALTTIDCPNMVLFVSELRANKGYIGHLNMPHLEELCMSDKEIVSLQWLNEVLNLKSMSLNHCSITAEHFDSFAKRAEFQGIESIQLMSNDLTTVGDLSHLVNLKYLNLKNNQITEISGLPPNLGSLNLSCNKLTSVAHISGLQKLHSLYISGNSIDSVRDLHDLPSLLELYLDESLSGDCGKLLLELPKLEIVPE